MPFNFTGDGMPIAYIRGGKYDGKTVYCSEVNEDEQGGGKTTEFDELTLDKNSKFEPTPMNMKWRDTCFIAGQSNSGKSFYVRMYLKNYKEVYPNRPIYLISRLDEDETLDQFRGIKRIKLDQEFIDDPLSATDFKNCLVIFDDTDSIRDTALKREVNKLKDDLLQVGRHGKVTMLITSHRPNRGHETSEVLNESNFTIFPKSGSPYDRMLRVYAGFNTKQIDALKKLPTRWVTILKAYPQVVLTERQVFFLADLLDHV